MTTEPTINRNALLAYVADLLGFQRHSLHSSPTTADVLTDEQRAWCAVCDLRRPTLAEVAERCGWSVWYARDVLHNLYRQGGVKRASGARWECVDLLHPASASATIADGRGVTSAPADLDTWPEKEAAMPLPDCSAPKPEAQPLSTQANSSRQHGHAICDDALIGVRGGGAG